MRRTVATVAFAALGAGFLAVSPAWAGGANDVPSNPLSTYDQYAPSGDDSANGNNKGKAVGRPEAGSVGKADAKNPPGQTKKYADPEVSTGAEYDNGYECDGNNGIAKGNPAHSGCEATPQGD